jgi:hypothetical protein
MIDEIINQIKIVRSQLMHSSFTEFVVFTVGESGGTYQVFISKNNKMIEKLEHD